MWHPVPFNSSLYEVSDTGCVRNCKTGKILSSGISKNGYLTVSLSNGKTRKTFYVHRLVCDAFVDNPQRLNVVNHKNEIRTDNRADNLEWVTQAENCQHSAHKQQLLWSFKDPDGNPVDCLGLKALCEKHGLNLGNMRSVHKGTRRSHKGWTK